MLSMILVRLVMGKKHNFVACTTLLINDQREWVDLSAIYGDCVGCFVAHRDNFTKFIPVDDIYVTCGWLKYNRFAGTN